MKNLILGIVAVGFTIGVFLESFVRFGFSFAGLFFVLALATFFFLQKEKSIQSKFANLLLPLFLIGLSLGIFRMAFTSPKDFPLDEFLNKKISVSGMIYEEPDKRETQTFLKIFVDKEILPKAKNISVKILVKTNQFSDFSYGDYVSVSGFLEKPESFETKSGGEFDYPSYLAKDGIYYILERSSVFKIESGHGNFLKSGLFKIKKKFVETIGRLIPEPESSLLAGLVVGGKQSLGSEWLKKFQTAGVMHIVVLSGYNITIVADSVMKFFGLFFSRLVSMGVGVLAIIFFAIMTGGSATVVRATIMAILVILAKATGRQYVVTRALIIAGLLMIIQNPVIVAFDPSFQLSFLATIALIYVSPVFESHLKFIPEKWKIKEIIVSTVSTQVFVLPLLLHMTGQFSIVGLFVNILILGAIPFTMFFGFWAGVLGLLSTILALPLAYIAYGLLWYELGMVKIFASFPFASISLPMISGFLTVLIYLVMVIILVSLKNRKKLQVKTL